MSKVLDSYGTLYFSRFKPCSSYIWGSQVMSVPSCFRDLMPLLHLFIRLFWKELMKKIWRSVKFSLKEKLRKFRMLHFFIFFGFFFSEIPWYLSLNPSTGWHKERLFGICTYEPGHAKTCLMTYANNKGADQPAHLRSLISTFVVRCLDSMICILAIAKVLRF